jgi:hypothetical protein
MQHRTAAGTRCLPNDLGKSFAIETMVDGFIYLDPTQFHDYFVVHLPVESATFMASNGGMPYERGATQWKSQAPELRSMSPDHRGNSENTP